MPKAIAVAPAVRGMYVKVKAVIAKTRQSVTCTLLVQHDALGATVMLRRTVDDAGDAVVVGYDALGSQQSNRIRAAAIQAAALGEQMLAKLWNDHVAHEKYWEGQARLQKYAEVQHAKTKARAKAKQAQG